MKILILITFFIVNLFAGKITDSSGNLVYLFEVENGAMVDTYFNIFNAIAMIFQSKDYLELLKIVFLLGGFFVFVISIIDFKRGIGLGSLKNIVKYLLIGTALLTIIFSHKSTIMIKTNTLSSFCPTGVTNKDSLVSLSPTTGVVVGNIPEVLAWTFSLINEVGKETTRLATIAFTAVDADLTINANKSDYASYLQGINTVLTSKLSDFTSDFSSQDKTSLLDGFSSLYRDCIASPAANSGSNGSLVMTAFSNTGDIRRTLKDYFDTSSNLNVYLNPTDPAKTTLLSNFIVNGGILPKNLLANINGEIFTCEQVWVKVDSILSAIEGSDKLLCKGNLKDYWNAQSLAIFTGDSTITGSVAGKNIVLNAALANQMYDLKNNIAPAEVSYASGKTIANLVTDNVGQGFYLAQTLPYLQMGMRAVMYAFFPFVFLVILLPNGISVVKNYLQTLIWIELWSPVAAVLNMFISIMSTDKFAEMYNVQGVNATQGMQLLSDSAMLAGLAGYLYAMIPALTWLLLKNSGQMLAGLGEGLAANFNANLNSDSINKDMGEKSGNNKLNQQRRARGEEMISLAEQDSLTAKIAGWESAGKFDQKFQNQDKLFNAASAKELVDISTNNQIGEMYMNNPNAKKHLASLESQVSGDIYKTTAEKTYTGEVNGNGVKNSIKTKDINTALGEDIGATKLEEKKVVDTFDKNLQEAHNAKAIGNVENMESQKKYLETQGKINGVDTSNNEKTADMIGLLAQTSANKKSVDEFIEQSYQIQNGLYVQNKDSWINRDNIGTVNMQADSYEKMKSISNALGTSKTVDTLKEQGLSDTFNISDRVQSNLNDNSTDIGQFSNEAMINKMNSMSTVHTFNSSSNGLQRKIKEVFGERSIIGAGNEIFEGVSKDTQAKKNTEVGFGATTKGKMDSNQDISDIFVKTELFNQLSNEATGMEEISKSLKEKNISLESVNLAANAQQSRLKEFNIQKAILADSAMAGLNDSVMGYNALLESGKLNELKTHVSLEENIKAQGDSEAISVKVTNNVVGALGVEGYALSLAAQEIMAAAKIIPDLFAEEDDPDKRKKKRKEQIAEENRKKRISELESKKDLNDREKSELRRLQGEQSNLENIRKDSPARQEKIKELYDKKKNGGLTQSERDELRRLVNIEKTTNFTSKEKKVPLSEKMRKLLTVNGLSKVAVDFTKGGVRIAGHVGRGMIGEALGIGEIELALDAAKTLANNKLVRAGSIGSTAGIAIVSAVQDNLSTTKDFRKPAIDLFNFETKALKAISEDKVGSIYTLNTAPKLNDIEREQNLIDIERTSGGKYFFVINGTRYATDIKDNDFTNEDGRFYKFSKGGENINASYFMESLNEAFKPGLKERDIAEEINGALAVSRSMTNGFNNSFVANVNEWFTEKFVPNTNIPTKK